VSAGYSVRRVGGRWSASFDLDADDCESVAAALGDGDTWAYDLLDAADELRRLTDPAPADPGADTSMFRPEE
jgi:hypothetical protein